MRCMSRKLQKNKVHEKRNGNPFPEQISRLVCWSNKVHSICSLNLESFG